MKKNFLIVSFLFLIANSSAIAHDARSTNVVDTYKSTYLEARFTKKIKKSEVNTIVELGCFSGLDAVVLNRYYGKPVFTFECDDCRFEQILENIAPYPEVTLVPYGAWDETKQMTFYHSDFTGASSFYEFDEESLAKWNKLTVEELIEQQGIRMHPLEVNAVRLDEWMQQEGIEQIDLLCIDIQGAALNALKGLGDHIE
jgi:FkbM family methyltransferase